jgi:hypothetical protein
MAISFSFDIDASDRKPLSADCAAPGVDASAGIALVLGDAMVLAGAGIVLSAGDATVAGVAGVVSAAVLSASLRWQPAASTASAIAASGRRMCVFMVEPPCAWVVLQS